MFAKSFFILTASSLLSLACSDGGAPDAAATAGSAGTASPSAGSANVAGNGGAGSGGSAAASGSSAGGSASQPASDDTLIVPKGLQVMQREGVNSIFNVIALTLRQDGPKGAQILASVRNDGDGPGCSPSFAVELYDKDGQSIGAGISGLLVQNFFRLSDGSDTIAACVTAGETTMATVDSLALDVPVENVAQVIYWSSYWGLDDLMPLGELSVGDLHAKTSTTGVSYTGSLTNQLDVPLSTPSVLVFPVNSVGRPLAVAHSEGTVEVPPAGSWAFETNAIPATGVDQVAFPAGGP